MAGATQRLRWIGAVTAAEVGDRRQHLSVAAADLAQHDQSFFAREGGGVRPVQLEYLLRELARPDRCDLTSGAGLLETQVGERQQDGVFICRRATRLIEQLQHPLTETDGVFVVFRVWRR